MSDFKKGDVVKLKSGGPSMTIETIGDGNANCAWFVDSEHRLANFSLDSLMHHADPEIKNLRDLGKSLA